MCIGFGYLSKIAFGVSDILVSHTQTVVTFIKQSDGDYGTTHTVFNFSLFA